jgi:hypothetical protein
MSEVLIVQVHPVSAVEMNDTKVRDEVGRVLDEASEPRLNTLASRGWSVDPPLLVHCLVAQVMLLFGLTYHMLLLVLEV